MTDDAVPKLGRFEQAGWRLPRPWELLYATIVIATGLLASGVLVTASIAWKACTAILAIAALIGVPVGVGHKGPREQMILAESDIATAEALGKPAPAKALAIVAASTGQTPEVQP